jgi:hypothetical protein
MVHSFFLFCLVKEKPIIDSLDLNSAVDLEYSQFKLNCRFGSKQIDLPIVSYVEEFLPTIKLKVYDYMSRELRKGKTADNVLITMFMYKYSRIDLTRLIKGTNVDDYMLEFVQDCDTTKCVYSPIVIYDHIKSAEQLVF